jgi:uncharacterized protein YegP (UPF0339 family)
VNYYFHLYQDQSGHWRWRLVAHNGKTIAASGEAFYSRENAHRSAELVQSVAGSAPIV